ncbi:hypothetical protein EYZ11_001356 [Aspergillus tanneri]|uniref:O-methyltransferase dimerisation domain-containing protein n=1 Tax=Aspergillus tanneri TaxID=1220188 RepID=A0A4S3JUW8_9EURO|nr:hypothetical protein EYZ11_001356 [Aspergillus tanneri]
MSPTLDMLSNARIYGHSNDNADRPSLSDGCIALQLNDPNAVPTLLKQIEKNGSTFRLNDGAASSVRLDLLNAARFLVYALETPREAMSTTFAAIEISVNLGLFKFLAVDDRPKSATELANATGAELVFLARILRHLAAMGVIKESGPDMYCRTGFSKAMTTPRFGDSYPCILHFFEFLQANPAISSLFHNHMSTYHLGRPSWIDDGFYPIEERLIRIASSSPEDVLIVDVGGSLGHDLSEFRRKFLQAPGRLVLQDLPTMLSQVENLDTDIELMAHDFFKVQPVKSASDIFSPRLWEEMTL